MQESWEGLRDEQAFQGQQWRRERGKNVLKRLDTLWGRKPLKKVEKNDRLKWNLHFLREPGLGPGKAGLGRLEAGL